MKVKNLRIKNITSVRKYLLIYTGIFQLTDAELDVLAEMIRYRLKGLHSKTDSDPFSVGAKKLISQRLGMGNPYSVNTYIKRLRDKGAILPGNKLHPWLIPMGERAIEIELEWKLNLD